MTPRNIALRGIAAVLWIAAAFEIFGGASVWREPLAGVANVREDGFVSYSFSLYRLAPPSFPCPPASPRPPTKNIYITNSHL